MHRNEDSEDNPPLERLRDLLAELAIEDEEHPEVGVHHDSGWCIAAYGRGYVTWEIPKVRIDEGKKVNDGKITTGRHMTGVTDEKIIELWTKLARGDIDGIEAEPWKPGYR